MAAVATDNSPPNGASGEADATTYRAQPLAGGKTVRFGDALETVQRDLGVEAVDETEPRSRRGIDQEIVYRGATLEFDSGRLQGIQFSVDKLGELALAPFAEDWKNLALNSEHGLSRATSRDDVNAFLDRWQAAAKAAGKRRGVDYEIETPEGGQSIRVRLGPARDIGRGRTSADRWRFEFHSELAPAYAGRLRAIVAEVDEFNTLGRTADPSAPPVFQQGGPAATTRTESQPSPGVWINGHVFRFGDAIGTAEQKLGVTATDHPSETARSGIDRIVKAPPFLLEFDAGKLRRITFDTTFRFEQPLQVFPESWKNLLPIGGQKLKKGMNREELDAYLAAWEQKLTASGLAKDRDFRVKTLGRGRFETVTISMRSAGPAPTGHRWYDTWQITFVRRGVEADGPAVLAGLRASRGNLDTRAPNPTQQMMKEARETQKNVPLPEIEMPDVPILETAN